MNLLSFVDELMKVGATRPILEKQAFGNDHEVNTADIPSGMADTGSPPPNLDPKPDDVGTRLRETAHLPSTVPSGEIGGVTSPKDPIDREKFNRVYYNPK